MTYDFQTTAQAKAAINSMFDMDTREGQRQAEQLMIVARIQDRDEFSGLELDRIGPVAQLSGFDQAHV